jgi:hypothetical protein
MQNKHKFVIGPKGANIAAIYQATGVLVTVPLIDDDTSAITMRGEGGALSRYGATGIQDRDVGNSILNR